MRRWILWGLITVSLSAACAFVVVRFFGDHHHHSHRPQSGPDFHAWLHDNLELSSDQHRLLQPIELAFEKERALAHQTIEQRSADLAEAIKNSAGYDQKMEAALVAFQDSQSVLQQLTLEHFFAMKEHLDDEQATKLRQWTHDSIIGQHQH